MRVSLWEISLFISALGFFVLCINLSYAVRSIDKTVRKTTEILEKNETKIDKIVENTSGIVENVKLVTNVSSIITGFISKSKNK